MHRRRGSPARFEAHRPSGRRRSRVGGIESVPGRRRSYEPPRHDSVSNKLLDRLIDELGRTLFRRRIVGLLVPGHLESMQPPAEFVPVRMGDGGGCEMNKTARVIDRMVGPARRCRQAGDCITTPYQGSGAALSGYVQRSKLPGLNRERVRTWPDSVLSPRSAFGSRAIHPPRLWGRAYPGIPRSRSGLSAHARHLGRSGAEAASAAPAALVPKPGAGVREEDRAEPGAQAAQDKPKDVDPKNKDTPRSPRSSCRCPATRRRDLRTPSGEPAKRTGPNDPSSSF